MHVPRPHAHRLRSRFGFFRYSQAKRVRCDTRLSRTRRLCEVRWYFGDVSYRARVTVRYADCQGDLCWAGRSRVAALDEYCHYVMELPRDECTRLFEGTVRGRVHPDQAAPTARSADPAPGRSK